MYIEADVPETYVKDITQQNVEVEFPVYKTMDATIGQAGNFLNPANRHLYG